MAKIDRATATPLGENALVGRLRNLSRGQGTLIALGLLVLFNVIFTPSFLTAQAITVNLTQVATIVIVGVGMTLVIATGGIDLSVGALMAIAGALAPLIFQDQIIPIADPMVANGLALVVPVLVAGLFGLFNGMLVTSFRIQPIVATLILFIAGRGIAQVMTNGELQTFNNPGFQFIGMGHLFGIPFQTLLMVAIVAGVAWVMRRTSFGRYILATGGNEAAAQLAGVPVHRVKRAVYGISGLFAGIAGLIVIAINSSSDANLVGLHMELDAIAAVAVGGTPLTGGQATIIGTFLGALFIQLLRFTLLAHGIPHAVAQVMNAALILIAVCLQQRQRRT